MQTNKQAVYGQVHKAHFYPVVGKQTTRKLLLGGHLAPKGGLLHLTLPATQGPRDVCVCVGGVCVCV